MPLILNDEQGMLRETARGFLAEKAPVAELRRLRDSKDPDGFSRDLWKAFAEMGFTGVLVPEAHGGLGPRPRRGRRGDGGDRAQPDRRRPSWPPRS